jgi:hypothetical protein
MIYFLINNNYHLELDIRLTKQLPGREFGLIQVPYSLNIIEESEIFSKVICFTRKIVPSLYDFVVHPFRIFSVQNEVVRKLKPAPDDILLVHTDMDLLNQYIVMLFYKANSRVFMLEDGMSTMCTYNLFPQKPPIKDKLRTLLLKKIYRFIYTDYAIFGEQLLPVMKDFIFKGVIVNYGNSILRNIPVYRLKQTKMNLNILYPRGAIFFNQPLYIWYLNENDYINYLIDLLIISNEFDPFYFKFHPSDNDLVIEKLTKIIKEKYSRIIIIEENNIAEKIIEEYPVRYAITFSSTSVLNLINRGIVPVFLNHLLNKEYPNSTFDAFDKFVESINCKVPSSLNDVNTLFNAFQDVVETSETRSLSDILS